MKVICAWCHELIRELPSEYMIDLRVSHGICEDCAREFEREKEKEGSQDANQ